MKGNIYGRSFSPSRSQGFPRNLRIPTVQHTFTLHAARHGLPARCLNVSHEEGLGECLMAGSEVPQPSEQIAESTGCFGRCLCGKVCSNAATSLSLPYLHLGGYFMSAQSCVDQKGYLCTPQFCPVGKSLRNLQFRIPSHGTSSDGL